MGKTASESDTALLLRYGRLVNDMRKAQRCYFAARRKGVPASDAGDLKDASMRLEREVDELTGEVLGFVTPSLFDLPPEEPS